MSKKDSEEFSVGVIQLAFNKKSRAVVGVLPWVAGMGRGKVKGSVDTGYSVLAFYKDRPECVVSARLFDTPEEAWSGVDEVKAYETYDDAIEALADAAVPKARGV